MAYQPKGRMSDVLPLLCERWCSQAYLMAITEGTSADIMAEIEAIRVHYVVEDTIVMNGLQGRPARHFRVVAPRFDD